MENSKFVLYSKTVVLLLLLLAIIMGRATMQDIAALQSTTAQIVEAALAIAAIVSRIEANKVLTILPKLKG